jgi:DNA-binding transcriptional ArsR family regulator
VSGDSDGNDPTSTGTISDKPNLTDPRAIRALAHPARLAILEYLGDRESATATECADIVGLSPSATSYHLRELAKYGLVQEAPGTDRRERRWRSSGGWRVGDDAGTDPAARAATQLLAPLVLARGDEQARRFFDATPHADPAWWDAANFSESRMRLTLDELRELTQACVELVESFAKRYPRKARAGRTDTRDVLLEIRAFPVPGPDERPTDT